MCLSSKAMIMKKNVLFVFTGILLISCNSGAPVNLDAKEKSDQSTVATENSTRKKDRNQAIEYHSNDVLGSTYQMNVNSSEGSASMNSTANTNTSGAPQEASLIDRKLIWNGRLVFEVKDMNKSFEQIRTICETNSGYISDMERTASDYEISNDITIRVASEHFHDLVQAIKGQSIHLDVASVNSADVTEEFIDIQNRLKTKREARERYIQILRNKTGTIQEVIEAEDAIRRITEEIEAKEGRLRYLEDQLSLSTITIRMYKTLSEKETVVATNNYANRTQSAFATGWNFIKEMTLVLIRLWPFLLVLGTVGFLKRKWLVQTMRRLKK